MRPSLVPSNVPLSPRLGNRRRPTFTEAPSNRSYSRHSNHQGVLLPLKIKASKASLKSHSSWKPCKRARTFLELARVGLEKLLRLAQEPALDRAVVPRPPEGQPLKPQLVRGRVVR